MSYPTPYPPHRVAGRTNWWAITASIVLGGYAVVVGIVLALWGSVGFYFPGFDEPAPTLAERMPGLVAGVTALGIPVVVLAALVLSIIGLVRPGLSRVVAVVVLVLAGMALVPAVWAGGVGFGLVFYAF